MTHVTSQEVVSGSWIPLTQNAVLKYSVHVSWLQFTNVCINYREARCEVASYPWRVGCATFLPCIVIVCMLSFLLMYNAIINLDNCTGSHTTNAKSNLSPVQLIVLFQARRHWTQYLTRAWCARFQVITINNQISELQKTFFKEKLAEYIQRGNSKLYR